VNAHDEFYTPEEVDAQIERASRLQEGDQADAEVIAYLRSFYQTDSQQESLDRMWNRIRRAAAWEHAHSEREKDSSMQTWQTENHNVAPMRPQQPPRPPSRFRQRLGLLAAVLVVLALVGSMTFVLYAAQHRGGVATTPTTGVTPHPTSTSSTTRAPLKIIAVNMTVTPTSIAGLACGTNVTVTYTATFQANANNAGGTVDFDYTVNNGRSETPASINFNPGETTTTYNFKWSGSLPADHTYPGLGGIQVISPNQLTATPVAPLGQCTSPAAAFQVTRVDMTVTPASIQGMACGTTVTVTYTATIHVAANSPGGTVQFTYTTDNGRGSTPASVTFSPGQTVQTFKFTWSGALPADHTSPGLGGIQISSPNQLTSSMVKPTGTCS
jgi:hypothetical protein